MNIDEKYEKKIRSFVITDNERDSCPTIVIFFRNIQKRPVNIDVFSIYGVEHTQICSI